MIKIITNFGELCRLAREEANAIKDRDPIKIKKAKEKHMKYKKLCLESDEMSIGLTHGDL